MNAGYLDLYRLLRERGHPPWCSARLALEYRNRWPLVLVKQTFRTWGVAKMTATEEFLKDLTELTRKHGIVLFSSPTDGTCLTALSPGMREGRYIVDEWDSGLSWSTGK